MAWERCGLFRVPRPIDEARVPPRPIDEARVSPRPIDGARVSPRPIDEVRVSPRPVDETRVPSRRIHSSGIYLKYWGPYLITKTALKPINLCCIKDKSIIKNTLKFYISCILHRFELQKSIFSCYRTPKITEKLDSFKQINFLSTRSWMTLVIYDFFHTT